MKKLSNDIITSIIEFNLVKLPIKRTILKDIIDIKNKLLNKCLINKYMYNRFKSNIHIISEIYRLIKKYRVYQYDYENYIKNNLKYSIGSPQLYDICLTGCTLPYAKSSFNEWSDEIEEDLYKVIEYFPTCFNFNKGYLRCREKVPILLAASINENIPIRILKILEKKGASWNDYVLLNSRKLSIIDDLRFNLKESRFNLIEKLCF